MVDKIHVQMQMPKIFVSKLRDTQTGEWNASHVPDVFRDHRDIVLSRVSGSSSRNIARKRADRRLISLNARLFKNSNSKEPARSAGLLKEIRYKVSCIDLLPVPYHTWTDCWLRSLTCLVAFFVHMPCCEVHLLLQLQLP